MVYSRAEHVFILEHIYFASKSFAVLREAFRNAYPDKEVPRLIVLMMEAASTCETSVNFYQTTWRNNPEDRHLHTRRRENLKSHEVKSC
jgi:hypothetical protein